MVLCLASQQWQYKNGIVFSGTPGTTGYGAVGPRTRVAMAQCLRNTKAVPVQSNSFPSVSFSSPTPSQTPTSQPAPAPTPATSPVPQPVQTGAPVLVTITRGVKTSGYGHWITAGSVPAGFKSEVRWKLLRDNASGAVPLHWCGFGFGTTLSRDSECEGMQSKLGVIGYIYTTEAADRVALYRCLVPNTGDRFISDYANCEGTSYVKETLIGYAYPAVPYALSISAPPSTVFPDDKMTISWKMTGTPPQGSSVGLALVAADSGLFVGSGIAVHQGVTGTYNWKVPCDTNGCGQIASGLYEIQAVFFPSEACYVSCEPADQLYVNSSPFTIAARPAPSGLSAACFTPHSGAATLSWKATPGATSYNLSVLLASTNTYHAVVNNLTTASYAVGIVPGEHYNMWVQAFFPSGTSTYTTVPFTCAQ